MEEAIKEKIAQGLLVNRHAWASRIGFRSPDGGRCLAGSSTEGVDLKLEASVECDSEKSRFARGCGCGSPC